MSENLSKEYLSAANSKRKGLYFSLAGDVRLDVKPIGCRRVTSLPPGSVVLIFCVNTPANASLQASVVRMKWVPSNRGAVKTGSETSRAFRFMNVAVCSAFPLVARMNEILL